MKPVASAQNADGTCDICREDADAGIADCGAQMGLSPETTKALIEDDAKPEVPLSFPKRMRRREKIEQKWAKRPFPAWLLERSRLKRLRIFTHQSTGHKHLERSSIEDALATLHSHLSKISQFRYNIPTALKSASKHFTRCRRGGGIPHDRHPLRDLCQEKIVHP